MSEPKVGAAFIKHEFDEAIAIQTALVAAGAQVAAAHPDAVSRSLLEAFGPGDEAALSALKLLGEPHGATGEQEEVAGSIVALLETTAAGAASAPSEAYEAHAVILSAKRKQADAAAGMRRIARDQGDAALHAVAQAMEQRQKLEAAQLADALAGFAVTLAAASSEPGTGSEGEPTPDARTAQRGASGRNATGRSATGRTSARRSA